MADSTPQFELRKSRRLDITLIAGIIVMLLFVIMAFNQRNHVAVTPAETEAFSPFILKVPNTTTPEDSPVTLTIALYSPNPALNGLKLSATSSNPTLLPKGSLLLSGTGTNRTLVLSPATNQFGSADVTLTLQAGTTEVKERFSLTVDPVNDPPRLNPIANISFSRDPILIRRGAIWKYLDDGSDPETDWRELTYNDQHWKSGPAPLGYGDSPKTEVSFGPKPNQKHITTYFRHAFNVSDPALYRSLTVSLQRDDGGVVYLNGNEVFRSGMRDGEVGHRTTAGKSSGDEADFFPATIDPARMHSGENVIAVEIHQSSPNSSDIRFDLDLVGDPEPSSQLLVELTGISPGPENEAAEVMTVSAISSNPEVIAVTELNYVHPNSTAKLTLAPGTPGQADVRVTVNDSENTNGIVRRTFTTYVNRPGNTVPALSTPGSRQIQQDTTTGPIAITINDRETPVDRLRLIGLSSNPGLVPDANIVFAGTGSDRTVEVTPLKGGLGEAAITIELIDEAFGMISSSFVLSVIPQPPPESGT